MDSFPVNTATACKLKWAWSTIFLNSGITRSCHRTAESALTKQTFQSFHNTDIKIQDRRDMLSGVWPEQNCHYCRDIERTGGVSDRMRQLTLPYRTPPELQVDPGATSVTPTLVEVYFNNTCNLGCLYCGPRLSSFIAAENQRHGTFHQHGVELLQPKKYLQELLPEFWKWFPEGFPKLSRLHVLGGEPFFQVEFDRLLEMIQLHPNPDCELNVVTNLMLPTARLNHYIDQFQGLLSAGCLRRIDITCSIDCWGPQQEYVRWGLDLAQWEQNFSRLLMIPEFYLNINQTISPLTIKTMPELLEKLNTWRQSHQVGHWFSAVNPGPEYLKPDILGREVFEPDIDRILSIMTQHTDEDRMAHEYMSGIFNAIPKRPRPDQIRDMFVYLREKDRRRGTDWQQFFPWLREFDRNVV